MPHTFNPRLGIDGELWCRDCEYHKEHAIHAAPLPPPDAPNLREALTELRDRLFASANQVLETDADMLQGARITERACAKEIDKLLAASGAPPVRQEHFCGGCHHRWEGDLTVVELCGDCWRKAHAVVHGAPPPQQKNQYGQIGNTDEGPDPRVDHSDAVGRQDLPRRTSLGDVPTWMREHVNDLLDSIVGCAAEADGAKLDCESYCEQLVTQLMTRLSAEAAPPAPKPSELLREKAQMEGMVASGFYAVDEEVAPPAPRWQPIATAPRDGTRIIVAWANGAVESAQFWTRDGKWNGHSRTNPTHWMPLPAPPVAANSPKPNAEFKQVKDWVK